MTKVKQCDMPPRMSKFVIDLVTEYNRSKTTLKDQVNGIKSILDKKYGETWHAIIGTEFYSALSFRKKNFIMLVYESGINLLIFRCSPVYPKYDPKFKTPSFTESDDSSIITQFNTFENNEFNYIKQLILFEEKEKSEENDIVVNLRKVLFHQTGKPHHILIFTKSKPEPIISQQNNPIKMEHCLLKYKNKYYYVLNHSGIEDNISYEFYSRIPSVLFLCTIICLFFYLYKQYNCSNICDVDTTECLRLISDCYESSKAYFYLTFILLFGGITSKYVFKS